MSTAKKLFYNACSVLPVQLLKAIAPSTALFPYHHLVSDEEVIHIKHLYSYKKKPQFIADLDHLLKHLKPLPVADLAASVKAGNKLPKNSFLLTFDDGFREVHDVIAPILEQKGVPAIFFINPAFIDNKELFYRCKLSLLIEAVTLQSSEAILNEIAKICNCKPDEAAISACIKKIDRKDDPVIDQLANALNVSFDEYLRSKQPFLSSEQLISLHKKGFTIGAHSWDHPYYKNISLEDQLEQTTSSCNYVKEKLHPVQITFSFPHTDEPLSQKLFDELLKTDIDLFFGVQNQKKELQNKMLHRFNAERPELPMKKQLNGLLVYMMLQKLTGKGKVHRS